MIKLSGAVPSIIKNPLSGAVPSIMNSDGRFLPTIVCDFCTCVFIESSVSHISLAGWNNLSGTVFPRVLYLTYLFVLFLDYVCVCVYVCVVTVL